MKQIHSLVSKLHNPDLGMLFIRVALGVVFINAGWFKIGNMAPVIEGFATMGFSPALAYFVAYAEFLGGAAILLGLGVRYAGIILSVIMLVALVKVHLPNGFSLQTGGYEYVFVLLFALLAVVTLGAGKYALEAKRG